MNRNVIRRVIAAALLGFLFGIYVHHDYVFWGRKGREVFIAHETRRFDEYMADPRPLAVTAVPMAIVSLFGFGLYELVVFGLSALIKPEASSAAATHQH